MTRKRFCKSFLNDRTDINMKNVLNKKTTVSLLNRSKSDYFRKLDEKD